ncbi:MAG: HU family DNA-binding protein [Oligoflexia bacterium]|nr:HU family DNA-binding protein [Oligoflexia bacterium]
MNKKELAAKLAKKAGLSQVKAMECVNALFDANTGSGIIAMELDAGNKVVVPGFGTFSSKNRAARIGTNPATGAKITIAAKSYVRFKPGKTLRERIEG